MELGHLEILPDSAIDKMDASIFPLLENQLALDKNLKLSKSLEFIFKNHIKDLLIDQKYTTIYIDAHVQVSTVLAVSYAQLCKNYDVEIAFLDCVNPIDTKQLKLYKIYYKNQLPIIFVFTTNDGLHCMGWNAEYLKVLHAVTPIDPGKIDKKATLNLLLEKIHGNGIASLTPGEITFLDSYFQS